MILTQHHAHFIAPFRILRHDFGAVEIDTESATRDISEVVVHRFDLSVKIVSVVRRRIYGVAAADIARQDLKKSTVARRTNTVILWKRNAECKNLHLIVRQNKLCKEGREKKKTES